MTKLKTTKLPASYKGVHELVHVDPRSLSDNPLNWKTHPQNQLRGLSSVIKDVGWAGAMLFNEATGRLIDGHGRKKRAIQDGESIVPVLIGSWTEDEEKRILATLDPLGQMFRTDEKALKALTESVRSEVKLLKRMEESDKEALTELTEQIADFASQIESGDSKRILFPQRKQKGKKVKVDSNDEQESDDEEQEPEDDSIYFNGSLEGDKEVIENVLFRGTNQWGIPDLRTDMLCSPDTLPNCVWNRTEQTNHELAYYCQSARPFDTKIGTRIEPKPPGGFLGFYTEDWRFEQCYDNPAIISDQLLDEQWHGVLEPDFSTYSNWPMAHVLWNVYRGRWCARYWQERGIPVIPLINSYPGGVEWQIKTLPTPCPVLANQLRLSHKKRDDKTLKIEIEAMKAAIAHCKPEAIILYGSLAHQKYCHTLLPKFKGKYVWLDSYINSRRKANPDRMP